MCTMEWIPIKGCSPRLEEMIRVPVEAGKNTKSAVESEICPDQFMADTEKIRRKQ